MSEGRVGIVPRAPYGRKRTGGRKGRGRGPCSFIPRLRRLAELLAGREWHTQSELAELAELHPKYMSAELSEIRRLGAAEFVVWRSRSRSGDGASAEAHRCGSGLAYYRIERTNHAGD